MTDNERLRILDALRAPRRDQLRERIILRSRKVVRECEQAIRDAGYWNKLHPAEQPLDFEDFRVMRDKAIKSLCEFGETP